MGIHSGCIYPRVSPAIRLDHALAIGDNAFYDWSELPWEGLCTHSPINEGVDGVELSPDELEAVAERRRKRKSVLLCAWSKADNARKRADTTPEFTALRKKINKRRYISKKAKRDSDVAKKVHCCQLCQKTYTGAKELVNHEATQLHQNESPVAKMTSRLHRVEFPIQTRSAINVTANLRNTFEMSRKSGIWSPCVSCLRLLQHTAWTISSDMKQIAPRELTLEATSKFHVLGQKSKTNAPLLPGTVELAQSDWSAIHGLLSPYSEHKQKRIMCVFSRSPSPRP